MNCDSNDVRVLAELTPVAEQLLERHLGTAREWFPHELIPWSRAQDFESGWTWAAEDAPDATAGLRSAIYLNLLTEDNLPYYFRDLERMFGADGAWGTWVRRWTAEEGRHSIVLRDYAVVTRIIDPVELERGRMCQVSGGTVPAPDSPLDALVYVALQELATRIAHLNTAKVLPDRAGYEIMKRVAADENLHYLYYRDLVAAALELDPSAVVCSIHRQLRSFQMPGTGIPDFAAHSRAIAGAGIYDLGIYLEQIVVPVVLRYWGLEQLEGLDASGEQARQRTLNHISRLSRLAQRLEDRAQTSAATSPPG
ncbi:MAG: acyl-[acyl-carrier-protein] desaturase [Acidimicrobiia bacterium]|nr:acyl-[acyl-carrier-protein] desaturase [Acidimicrobiia bacterium]